MLLTNGKKFNWYFLTFFIKINFIKCSIINF